MPSFDLSSLPGDNGDMSREPNELALFSPSLKRTVLERYNSSPSRRSVDDRLVF